MSHFKARLQLFFLQPFRWYVIACAFAMFGNGLTYVVMTWLLLNHQNSVSAIAILMTCFWLPGVILGPFLGVLADRWDRKKLLIFANASRALILLGFWYLLHGLPSVWMIYLLAVVSGSILSLHIPAAMALVRELVSKDQLLYANATVDIAYEVGAVAGMGCAGLIIALSSTKTTFMINALCYVVATISLLLMRHEGQKRKLKKSRHGFVIQFISGWRYLSRRKSLLMLYTIQMLFFICYMTAPILLAPYAKSVLHTDVGQFGMIEASLSVGLVLGGCFSPYLAEKYGVMQILIIESLLCALYFYLFSQTQSLILAELLYFMIGFCFSAWALIITFAQDLTDINYQGRVQSLFSSLSGAVIIAFYYLLSTAGDLIRLDRLYWCEVILMLISLGLLLYYRSHLLSE